MSEEIDSIAAEEAELGIYEDVASTATDQSAHEQITADTAADDCTTPTPETAGREETNLVKQQPNEDIIITPGPKSESLERKVIFSANLKTDRDTLQSRNSVDKALQIKGILRKSYQPTPPLPTPETRSQANSCLPPPLTDKNASNTDSEDRDDRPEETSKELESIVRDIDYVKKKCLGNDVRRGRTAPVYSVGRNLGGVTGSDNQSYARSLLRSQSSAGNVLLYQQRPSPMAPLRAWKGFGGNIYFTPLNISRVNSAGGAIETVSRSQTGSAAPTSNRHQTAKPQINNMAFHCELPQKPAIVMDKQVVMNKNNKDIQEDLEWIRNTENVGSLRIERGPGDSRTKERKLDRKSGVYKGSVVHQQVVQQQGDKLRQQRQPRNSKRSSGYVLKISGDRYDTHGHSNQLLMSTTQYSQSRHRSRSMSGTKQPEVQEMEANTRTDQLTSCYRKTNAKNRLPTLQHLKDIKTGRYNGGGIKTQ